MGPFTHSTDFIRACALTKNKRQDDDSCTCLDTLIKILDITTNNELSPTTTLNFGSQCFTALRKDISDLKKKRPASIGIAPRRVNSAVLPEHHRDDTARLHAPDGQCGIAVKGGLEFIVHKARAQRHLLIDAPNKSAQPASRILLLLDLASAFNETSRDARRLLLSSTPKLQDMVPHFDQARKEPNRRCWHQADEGSCRHFPQREGFARGMPTEWKPRWNRTLQSFKENKHRNHFQTEPSTSSLADDTNLLLTLQDVAWFIKRFDELGKPLGIKLNPKKTQPLIGPRARSSTHQKEILKHVETIPQPKNILTDGCKLLGQAIGTHTCVTNYVQQQATKCRATVSRITTRLLDRQTMSSICRRCAQPAAAHLMGTDALNTRDQQGTPPSTRSPH